MTGYYTTRLVAVLNIWVWDTLEKIELKYTFQYIFCNEMEFTSKIEIKQSILNLFCNYSTFPLIKQDCDMSYFPREMAIACPISRKYK